MRPRISIRGYVRLLVRCLVHLSIHPSICCSIRLSVHPSICPSIRNPFFLLSKNGWKCQKRLFQCFTLNLSFISLSHSLFQNLLFTFFLHNLSFLIFPLQSFFHSLSFTIFLSQSYFILSKTLDASMPAPGLILQYLKYLYWFVFKKRARERTTMRLTFCRDWKTRWKEILWKKDCGSTIVK